MALGEAGMDSHVVGKALFVLEALEGHLRLRRPREALLKHLIALVPHIKRCDLIGPIKMRENERDGLLPTLTTH